MKHKFTEIKLPDLRVFVNAAINGEITIVGEHVVAKTGSAAGRIRTAIKNMLLRDMYIKNSIPSAKAANLPIELTENPATGVYTKYSIKKTCGVFRCVNPACYSLVHQESVGRLPRPSHQELRDLADDLDLDRIDQIGIEEYMFEYNDKLPKFLRVKKNDIEDALKIIERHNLCVQNRQSKKN